MISVVQSFLLIQTHEEPNVASKFIHVVILVSPGGSTSAFESKTSSTKDHKVAVKIPSSYANLITRDNHECCHSHFHP